jgi:hypothetical protein
MQHTPREKLQINDKLRGLQACVQAKQEAMLSVRSKSNVWQPHQLPQPGPVSPLVSGIFGKPVNTPPSGLPTTYLLIRPAVFQGAGSGIDFPRILFVALDLVSPNL